jgi:nucleoside phosphorylase
LSGSAGPRVLASGTQYWGRLLRTASGDRIGTVLACIGTAGNVDAAAAVTEIITSFRPRLLLMVGIAAGMRGRIRLGEVVLSERIVGYEPAALVASPAPAEEPRPEHFRPDHATQQQMVAYLSGGHTLLERLGNKMAASGVGPPAGAPVEDFADGLPVRPATLASGEKLLRDPERLRMMRANLHGKIEIAEMEAAGIAVACGRTGTPYLVIRGISDFGDRAKTDGAHMLAATAAAIVAIDFAEHGYSRST